MTTPLAGQWMGKMAGTNQGYLMLSIDPDRPTVGWLQVNDPQQCFTANFTLPQSGSTITGNLTNFHTQTYGTNPGITLPQTCAVSATINGNNLTGSWQTDVQTQGTFGLVRTENLAPYPADQKMEWHDFRNWVLNETNKNPSLMFRGHADSQHCLITSFHRTGRRNLLRYDREDIQRLCRHVEATLGTSYNLQDRFDYSELLYLAQHHGFPTPLLDWTESPFVAAYFAFHKSPAPNIPQDRDVRIFMFDPTNWPYGIVNTIVDIEPRFAPLYPRARANPRALPQQSVAMFCNLVLLEAFIQSVETTLDSRFLRRIDIPISQRPIAMQELAKMGLTAATLFPGLEGVCTALAERYFF